MKYQSLNYGKGYEELTRIEHRISRHAKDLFKALEDLQTILADNMPKDGTYYSPDGDRLDESLLNEMVIQLEDIKKAYTYE